MLGRGDVAKDVAHRTHDTGGVERGVDGGFAVVAHQKAAKGPAARFEPAFTMLPLGNVAVGVFEVAACGFGTEVAPRANHSVAQKPAVGFV